MSRHAPHCPNCNSPRSRVEDVRARNGVLWRARECGDCSHPYETEERVISQEARP